MTIKQREEKLRECIELEAPMIQFQIDTLSFDFIREMRDQINGFALLKYQIYSIQHLTEKQIDELRRYYKVFD